MKSTLGQNITFRQIDDEYILIHSGQGVFYVLNEAAGYILEHLDTVSCVREMAGLMARVFDCDPKRAEADATEFLRIAAEAKIICVNDSVMDSAAPVDNVQEVKRPYTRPEILSIDNLQAVAGLCDSGHSGGSACRTSPPFCVQLFS